jgi:putative DNA primase/helicase
MMNTDFIPAPDSTPEALPDGFAMRKTGLWFIEQDSDSGPVKELWLCAPLKILGRTRDKASNSWGLLLQWSDPDGKLHTWAMPGELLAGREQAPWLGRLLDEGLTIASGRKARSMLGLFLATYKTGQRVLCVSSTGWHDGVYMLPDETLGFSEKGRIVLQSRRAINPFQTGGSLAGWQKTVAAWASGNSRLIMSLASSMAAPLMLPAGIESGGFNFSGDSSIGKTTSLEVAASCWGSGRAGGFVQNWRATVNGFEALAALHNDSLLALDEISQCPAQSVAEAAYLLANGQGKSRAAQDGALREARCWRCMILSTGEGGLAARLAEEGKRVKAGQEVRLLDIPADAGAGLGLFENIHGFNSAQAFADALKKAASTHYGHASRIFIKAFIKNRMEAEPALHSGFNNYLDTICPANADGQVRRAARRFMLCALAGEMAIEWQILLWEAGSVLRAIKRCFADWLEQRGGSGPQEDKAVLHQIRLFFEQHGGSRFQRIDNHDSPVLNRAGFREEVCGETVYYILPESFKEICQGHNVKQAAKVLKMAGMLKTDNDRLQQWLPALPGLGRQRGYVLRFADNHENEF